MYNIRVKNINTGEKKYFRKLGRAFAWAEYDKQNIGKSLVVQVREGNAWYSATYGGDGIAAKAYANEMPDYS